ncbi:MULTISPECIES: hypothetical protein [unclassified Curtobacterium]|uniref:hypothetical protein n=1 Tax=unclassified Curtobacterium TaxID=257496 RepID=UPI003A80681F
MTDPVDSDALRKLAAQCNDNNYNADNGWLLGSAADALDVAADELDRLRLAIENAPHENTRSTPCNAALFETAGCTCWKAGAR